MSKDDQIRALKARVAELEAALRPFVKRGLVRGVVISDQPKRES